MGGGFRRAELDCELTRGLPRQLVRACQAARTSDGAADVAWPGVRMLIR